MQSAMPAVLRTPPPGSRRPHAAGSGTTPLAKRVPDRVPSNPALTQLSTDEVSALAQGMKAQMDSDAVWLIKLLEAVNEHGEAFDRQHESIKQHTALVTLIGGRIAEMKSNDKITETMILEGDATIKEIVGKNDQMIKDEVNKNDMDVRSVVAANDMAIKSAMAILDEKLTHAMSTNTIIRQQAETSTNGWEARLAKLERHCAGGEGGSAVHAHMEVLRTKIDESHANIMINVRAIAGIGSRVATMGNSTTAAAAAAPTMAAGIGVDPMTLPGKDPWPASGMPTFSAAASGPATSGAWQAGGMPGIGASAGGPATSGA